MAQKIVSRSFKTPPSCHVRSIILNSVKQTADVSYDCGGGGRGTFPSPGGGTSNYPKALIKGVRAVNVPGGRVYGQAVNIGFTLSPRYVKCHKKAADTELTCQLYNDVGVLAGAGGRKKRRRR